MPAERLKGRGGGEGGGREKGERMTDSKQEETSDIAGLPSGYCACDVCCYRRCRVHTVRDMMFYYISIT